MDFTAETDSAGLRAEMWKSTAGLSALAGLSVQVDLKDSR